MLALLALVLFPVAAQAENSGEKVYETEVPSIESEPVHKETPKSHESHGSGTPKEAHGSAAEGTGTEGSSVEPESETSEGSGGGKHQSGGAPGGGNGNPPKGGGGNGGKEGSQTGGKSKVGVGPGQKVVKNVSGKPASSSSSSSSPLVPILIAVIVLAAISIGVVLYRQRKSGQGPDGRADVSSSNAS
jgi:cobalamin biosynthesis Mg chelatase CobN